VDFFNEIAEHLLRHFEITHDSVNERAGCDDVRRGFPDHFARFGADGQNLSGLLVHRHDGRLVDDNPPAFDIDKSVGRSEVNPDIF